MPPKPRISMPSRYANFFDVLVHLQKECVRTGLHLVPIHERIYDELSGGFDEEGISRLHSWWCYDIERLLAERGRRYENPKPRISLSINFNQRGTFIVSWQPTSKDFDDLSDSDFRALPYSPYSNDENRLINIRDLQDITYSHRKENEDPGPKVQQLLERIRVSATRYEEPPEIKVIDAILLQAAAKLVNDLKSRLEMNFTITMIEDIYMGWTERKITEPDSLLWWKIENVAEHEKAEELSLLDRFEAEFGCSLTKFAEISFAPDKKKGTGPEPMAHTKPERVARTFKALGFSKVTPRIVRKYSELLEKRRPELLPEVPPDLRNVVPLRRKDTGVE